MEEGTKKKHAKDLFAVAPSKFIDLSNGSKAEIKQGTGKTVMYVERLLRGMKGAEREDKYNLAMMSLLIVIDGKSYQMEELEKLNQKDFMTLYTEYIELNF